MSDELWGDCDGKTVKEHAYGQGRVVWGIAPEKVLAASRFGIKQVILPDQNRADWSEVPEEVRHKLGVHFIRHIAELLPLALREK